MPNLPSARGDGEMPLPDPDVLELEASITYCERSYKTQVLIGKPMSCHQEDQLACHTNHLHRWLQRREWYVAAVRGNRKQNKVAAKARAQAKALGFRYAEQLTIDAGCLDIAAVTHLISKDWCHLSGLDLSNNSMGTDSLQLLAKGAWHHLSSLNLTGNKLEPEALSQICSAGWPLKVSSASLLLVDNSDVSNCRSHSQCAHEVAHGEEVCITTCDCHVQSSKLTFSCAYIWLDSLSVSGRVAYFMHS